MRCLMGVVPSFVIVCICSCSYYWTDGGDIRKEVEQKFSDSTRDYEYDSDFLEESQEGMGLKSSGSGRTTDEFLCNLLGSNSKIKKEAPDAINYFCNQGGFAKIRESSYENYKLDNEGLLFEDLTDSQKPKIIKITDTHNGTLGRSTFSAVSGSVDRGSIVSFEKLHSSYCGGLATYRAAYKPKGLEHINNLGIEEIAQLTIPKVIEQSNFKGCSYSVVLDVANFSGMSITASYDGNLVYMHAADSKVFFEINYLVKSKGLVSNLLIFTLAVEDDDGFVQTYNFKSTTVNSFFLKDPPVINSSKNPIHSQLVGKGLDVISRGLYYKTKVLQNL